MVQRNHSVFSARPRNRTCVFLAFSWLSGHVVGLLIYMCNANMLSALMRRITFVPVSIVGLQLLFLLPFLFSALAVYFHSPIWIYPISAFRGLVFSFVSLGLMHSFGSAGWLYRLLFLMGNMLSLPVLYLYWMRSLSKLRGIRI